VALANEWSQSPQHIPQSIDLTSGVVKQHDADFKIPEHDSDLRANFNDAVSLRVSDLVSLSPASLIR